MSSSASILCPYKWNSWVKTAFVIISISTLVGSGMKVCTHYRKSKAVAGVPDPKGGVEIITPLLAYQKEQIHKDQETTTGPEIEM